MAEKTLRLELNDMVRELLEIREELKPRLAGLKEIGKPVALVLAGFIGLKIGFKILRWALSLLWRNLLVIAAVVVFALIRYNQVKKRKAGEFYIGGGSGTV